MSKINILIVIIAVSLLSAGTASALFVDYNSASGFILDESIKLENFDTIEFLRKAGGTGNFEINNSSGDIQFRFGKDSGATDKFFQIKNSNGDQVFRVLDNGNLQIGGNSVGGFGRVKVQLGSESSGVYTLNDPSGDSAYISFSIGSSLTGRSHNNGLIIRRAATGTNAGDWMNVGVRNKNSKGWAFIGYKSGDTGVWVNSDGMMVDGGLAMIQYDATVIGSDLSVGGELNLNKTKLTLDDSASMNVSGDLNLTQSILTNEPVGDNILSVSGNVYVDNKSLISFEKPIDTVIAGNLFLTGGKVNIGATNKWCIKDDSSPGNIEFHKDTNTFECSDDILPVSAYRYVINNLGTPNDNDVVTKDYVNSFFSKASEVPDATLDYSDICEVSQTTSGTTDAGCSTTNKLQDILTLSSHAH